MRERPGPRTSRWTTAALAAAVGLPLLLQGPAGAAPLPPPNGTINEPTLLPYDSSVPSKLKAPAGFTVSEYAKGLGNPRFLAVNARDGSVWVTRRETGDVVALLDDDKDGVADRTVRAAHGLKQVNGIFISGEDIYLATEHQVLSATLRNGGKLKNLKVIANDLPDAGQHPNRTLAVGPDNWLYVTVGSLCNACENRDPDTATMWRMHRDGTHQQVFARGLRNTIGFGWVPGTRWLFGMDHGSDWRGDDQPPEELNLIQRDRNYGWPWCFADKQADPYIPNHPQGMSKAGFCSSSTTAPTLTYTAHSAPLQMLFVQGNRSFPKDYDGDAFVAMRGSWNRSQPSGYKIVRVRFDGAKPVGFEDFLTGFLTEDSTGIYGRPVGLAQLPDGSLLVGDDTNGTVFRVAVAKG